MLERIWQLITMQLPPHGYCLYWDPVLVGAHVVSDTVTAISYFTIPIALIRLVGGRRDIKFGWIFYLFATFILACGLTHVMMIWNLWHGDYGIEALVKIVMASASLGTAIVLWPMIPHLIAIPSTQHLKDLNEKLELSNKELATALIKLQSETEEKERAQAILIQSQKMEAVGQLTGGIAHDFNNLLMGISGNFELIKNNPGSERISKWVGTGIDAVARAAHLTAQLLTFSRVQKLQLKEIHLQPLLSNLMEMITRTIGPDVRVMLKSQDDVVIKADPIQLELAILNLSLNARDAMSGGGNITISTNVINGAVEIDVTDTGSGIPEELVSRVFEPFFTTKDIGKGTGLGLSMVYGVASQSGGDVYIKKTSPKGTTITISMPLVVLVEEVTVSIDQTDLLSKSGNNQTILLIDDDDTVRETLSEILLTMGYYVEMAEDGVVALNYLKNNKPDLILVDYAMPVMNGAAVVKAAQLIYSDVPIVFVTGYSESSALEGYTVLKKPFVIQDIKRLLNTIFK